VLIAQLDLSHRLINKGNEVQAAQSKARYALRTTAIADCGAMWSTGSYWSAGVPKADKLMTGPQVDAFAKRHPSAEIIDVIVHRAACDVWMKAFRAATVANSTHEQRQAARAAGDAAVKAAGYRLPVGSAA
jgi:hypothetical protein